MIKVVGVRFRNGGKVYYFDPGDLDVHLKDRVIVETSRGTEFGQAVTPPIETESDKIKRMPTPIERLATEDDLARDAENKRKQDEAYHICKEKIHEHGLPMNLVDAEYTFDNSKLTFYFTADGRVDFRALVKDLAGVFHTRIELRQIGVRDETRLLGGFGVCGRELCCSTFLTEFHPVSIKMAKEQNMSLNPGKISGLCGRLMCCLKNEAGAYEYLNKTLPRKGDAIKTRDGRDGEVMNVNILRQRVRVLFEDGDNREVEEFDAADLVFDPKVHHRVRHARREDKDSGRQARAGSPRGGGPNGADSKRDTPKTGTDNGKKQEMRKDRPPRQGRSGRPNRSSYGGRNTGRGRGRQQGKKNGEE